MISRELSIVGASTVLTTTRPSLNFLILKSRLNCPGKHILPDNEVIASAGE